MMDMTARFGRMGALIGMLILALVASTAAPSIAGGQAVQPQCSDAVDNDSDGAVDGADAGCADGSDGDETDSPYSGIVLVTVPLPVVTLQGTVSAKGTVDVDRLQIRALRGTSVAIACKGRACPFKSLRRIMITSSLRLGKLERKLKPTMTITMRIARPGQLGKYVRYQIRRNKSPKRTDACLHQATRQVRGCFTG